VADAVGVAVGLAAWQTLGMTRQMPAAGGRPTVVIHTNDAQSIPARVAAHALRSRSQSADRFDVRLLRFEETPALYRRDGRPFVWWEGDAPSVFRWRDLQSFAPLRRMVPALLGFEGRALVLDPDVFAIGDVYELLARDMHGKAIMCRRALRSHAGRPVYSSAVMLLDCGKLTHWQWERDLDDIFRGTTPLGAWLGLLDESPDRIGLFEDEWNSFDVLNEKTKMLHNTEIETQPWKTGLPADFHEHAPRWPAPFEAVRRGVQRLVLRRHTPRVCYRPHPDPRQERLFFTLLRECVDAGSITRGEIRVAMRRNHLRRDAFNLLDGVSRG
jgi:hypothetical protein